MNLTAKLCTLVAWSSLTNAIPLSRNSPLTSRSSTLHNVARDDSGYLDLLDWNSGALASPEPQLSQGGTSDLTSTVMDSSANLYDPVSMLSDQWNTIDESHVPSGLANPNGYTCLKDCSYTASMMSSGLDSSSEASYKDMFHSDEPFLPPDDAWEVEPGAWFEAERGSGRGAHKTSISSPTTGIEQGKRGSGKASSANHHAIGDGLISLGDGGQPGPDLFASSIVA